MKAILPKLNKIQTELKAPKGQYNAYGKYHYRSCEDILNALKPFLKELNLILTINDEIEQVGDRFYVHAVVRLLDVESGEEVNASAYARESAERKGMDASQITGATSSYARKYALNALFAIDDTRDADTQDNSQAQFTAKHQADINACQTVEELKQYWETHQGLGKEFAQAVSKRKKELYENSQNGTGDTGVVADQSGQDDRQRSASDSQQREGAGDSELEDIGDSIQ